MGATIMILGAGMGGIVAANRLRRSLPEAHRVVIVDLEDTHVFMSSLPWLMTGARRVADITRPLASLERRGIERIHGAVEHIDAETRTVTVMGRTLQADYLVIALGAELAPETIPGLPESGHNFYTLRGAESFRDAFAAFSGGRLVVLTAGHPYRCPAAPYEVAFLIEAACRRRGIRAGTRIDVYAAEPMPMGVAGPAVSGPARALLTTRNIGYYPEHQIIRVDADKRCLYFGNGVEAAFDLLAYVPPHRVPRVVHASGLAVEGKYVEVHPATLETHFERVWAIGDVNGIMLGIGKPLPKAGVFATAQAEVVASNIVRAITGRGSPATFDGHGMCFLEMGGGMAGLGRGNFYAQPAPDVKMHWPGPHWHLGKVLLEKYWLRRWF